MFQRSVTLYALLFSANTLLLNLLNSMFSSDMPGSGLQRVFPTVYTTNQLSFQLNHHRFHFTSLTYSIQVTASYIIQIPWYVCF